MDTVAVGRALPRGRFTLVVVGDDEHVEAVDNGADSCRGVVAYDV
jgi:hypothetical protein